jgi:sporulation protein YlmC with PRC-barrel domain
MNNMKTSLVTSLVMAAALASIGTTHAQVAGSTLVGITVTESSQVARGWSVKRSILGKNVYNDVGDKVGKIEDIIITPERNVSYLIVGAGGFIGIGRHDVAIPASQAKELSGRIVIAGATKDVVKAMPEFEYAKGTGERDQFIARGEQDLVKGKEKMTELQKQAKDASLDAKAAIDLKVSGLELDLKSAESKLDEMKHASAKRWKEFEGSVSVAMARLRKAIG